MPVFIATDASVAAVDVKAQQAPQLSWSFTVVITLRPSLLLEVLQSTDSGGLLREREVTEQ